MANFSGSVLRDSDEGVYSGFPRTALLQVGRGSVLSEMLPKLTPLRTASAWSPVRAP